MDAIDKVTVPEGERGAWTIQRFTVRDDESEFTALRSIGRGRGYVPAATYTKLVHAQRGIVMSDTPDELRDHLSAYYAARGNVLINGLGLGVIAGAVLNKDGVDHVTVIEIDADVIALVGPHYACNRLTIINADAFTYKPPKGARYDMVWHDVWDTICADNLPEMTKLKRRYGRRADWQGCWC